MFEFSLKNGKTQLVGGLKCLIVIFVLAIVWICFSLIPNETVQIIFVILFSISIGILGLLSAIKIIFGAIVYHAERTAMKTTNQLNAERDKEFSEQYREIRKQLKKQKRAS